MIPWVASLAAGLALAAFTYGLRVQHAARLTYALRAFVGTVVVALLLNAPLGPARVAAPWVGLDVSGSWLAGGDSARWLAARAVADSALGAGADSLLVFGDSLRVPSGTPVAADRATQVGPLVDAVLAVGRPVVVVTDGMIDDPERLSRLPRGSRVIVLAPDSAADAAITALDVPAGALGGDTITARIVIKAGAGGAMAGRARVTLDGRLLSEVDVAGLGPYEERELRVPVALPASDASRHVAVSLAGGDAVAGNDSARVEVVVSGAAAAVFASTMPDQDARFALAVLRGTRRGPVQGFWRVAPGQWRTDGAMRVVTEESVRNALRRAPLAVIHGDTALFGAPRAAAPNALVLFAPPAPGEDYYPTGTGDSPLVAALAGVPWDSLPPLDVAPLRAPSQYTAVVARRARRFDERAVVGLTDGARRIAIIPASGLWRWRLRGGRASDAFDAVWGSIFDWVGSTAESLRAARGSRLQTAAERAGIAPELMPRRPTVVSGEVGEGAALDLAPRARGAAGWWLAALALTALCAEWLLRRRIGLR
jgi:hypothetical protein